jgi:Cytochrome c
LQHGEYLINLYDCYACHSNNFQTLNIKEPRKSKGYLGGGNAVYNLKGEKVLTPNLTPDEDTGIGTWTEQMFADAVRNGKNQRGGEALKYPMLPYSRLTDAEIKAMFAYLKTVPPIKNKVH